MESAQTHAETMPVTQSEHHHIYLVFVLTVAICCEPATDISWNIDSAGIIQYM